MRAAVLPVALAALIPVSVACDAVRAGSDPPPGAGAGRPATPARLKLRDAAHHPRLSLVARGGDPSPAIAIAVAHDYGSEASTALATLVETRVRAAGFDTAESRPHAAGYQVRALVDGPEQAGRFVRAATAALLTPVENDERAMAIIARRLEALKSRTWRGPTEAAAATCVGELGILPDAPLLDARSTAGRQRLEQLRQGAHSLGGIAFGVLGAQPVLDATTLALDATPPWPKGRGPTDVWPDRDLVGSDPSPADGRRLSIALRVPETAGAIAAARTLASPSSELNTLLGSLDPPWAMDRVVSTTRPRGACLRIDLLGPTEGAAPAPQAVARVAMIASVETRAALDATPASPWTLEDSVLRTADPRAAAAAAAWGALSGRLDAGAPRRIVSYQPPPSEAGDRTVAELRAELDRLEKQWARPVVDVKSRVEAGQGEIWMLLASPCGTAMEDATDAGWRGLAMRTAAMRETDDISLEPWVTPDGVGILAHGARSGPAETPAAHAARVGAALGRAITTTLSATDFAETRPTLVADIGPAPQPNWWMAVESLAIGHPSWLEPRGTFQSVTNATLHETEHRRRMLVGGPLRLAVLASWDAAQAGAAGSAIDRWIRPFKTDQQCPAGTTRKARAGEITIETDDDSHLRARAIVGAPLPARAGAGLAPEARWTAWLLNRPGGWLDRALERPGLASRAEAKLLGGGRAAALIVEIDALDESLTEATAQVRGLLARLASGAVTAAEADRARQHFAGARRAAQLDPRRRVVDLWHGGAPTREPDVASLRRFHAQAFRSESHVLVYVKRRP